MAFRRTSNVTYMPRALSWGLCTNDECEAFNEIVKMAKDFGIFGIVVQAGSCKRPICSMHVKPVTCSFNNCHYQWYGIKAGATAEDVPRECGAESFKTVRDEYHRFDKSEQFGNGLASWTQLTILTWELSSINIVFVEREEVLKTRGEGTSVMLEGFICPITMEFMCKPVMANDGQSYEKSAICAWMEVSDMLPLTRERLRPELTKNWNFLKAIENWQAR